jgi:nucleotide-binding universal stress UspA family protein
VTEPLRLRTLLVPLDFSETSKRALGVARALMKKVGPSHLVLVHAYFLPAEVEALAEDTQTLILETMSNKAREDLEGILVELQDEGISAEFLTRHGSQERVIIDAAEERKADLIVMGTHGRRGLSHAILGSVAERVLRTAACPVLTVGAPKS